MQAVSFPGYGRVEIIEVPRPALGEPGDAIVLITTAAIGPWDIERFLSIGEGDTVPGGEFAGMVVETGADVTTIELDDLVTNTVFHSSAHGRGDLFGSNTLPGGHAEYVRVPDADNTLAKIAPSGEERAVLAGGTVGLGVNVAAQALVQAPGATYAVVGCDPIGMTALIALRGAADTGRLIAIEDHDARNTLASSFASEVLRSSQILPEQQVDVVIVGSISEYAGFDAVKTLVKPGGQIIFSEPYGPTRVAESGISLPEGVPISSASWPTSADIAKIIIAIQIRRLDLTPLVSHMFPLDEAQNAYAAAAETGPGVQKVLLKP